MNNIELQKSLKNKSFVYTNIFAITPTVLFLVLCIYIIGFISNTNPLLSKNQLALCYIFFALVIIVDILVFIYGMIQYICCRKIIKKISNNEEISLRLKKISLLVNIQGLEENKINFVKFNRIRIILTSLSINFINLVVILIISLVSNAFNIVFYELNVNSTWDIKYLILTILFFIIAATFIFKVIYLSYLYFYYGSGQKILKLLAIITGSLVVYKKLIYFNKAIN